MRRRTFIAGLGGAVTWPLAAKAQRRALPVIGILSTGSEQQRDSSFLAFLEGLKETGFVEGRNVAIEYAYARNDYDRLPELATDLVRRRATVLYTGVNTAAAIAGKAATSTIPIVFGVGDDPVQLGLVASFNSPGGNLTGASLLLTETAAKRVEMLHEAAPKAGRAAALFDPRNPAAEAERRELMKAARILGLEFRAFEATNENEIDSTLEAVAQMPGAMLVIEGDPVFTNRLNQLAGLTLRHAIPAIYPIREFPQAGGLMSHGSSVQEAARIAGTYTGRILKGEKPADLPVQQVTRVELVINMASAKAIGLTFPLSLLGRADEVIE